MIVITAAMRAKQGKEDELIAAMKELAAAVRKNEPGALDYTFHRAQRDRSLFMVYEKYQDSEAMKAHMGSAHFQNAAKLFGSLLEGGLGIETYEVLV
jgi:autoinducer 2-degrading protein